MPFKIDTVTYDIGIIDMDRNFDKLYKNAERSQDGTIHKELIGVYFNFPRVIMGMSKNNQADYEALIDVLADTSEFHSVTVPGINGADVTFDAYFDAVKDRVYKWEMGSVWYFRELSFAIIARSPARVP